MNIIRLCLNLDMHVISVFVWTIASRSHLLYARPSLKYDAYCFELLSSLLQPVAQPYMCSRFSGRFTDTDTLITAAFFGGTVLQCRLSLNCMISSTRFKYLSCGIVTQSLSVCHSRPGRQYFEESTSV